MLVPTRKIGSYRSLLYYSHFVTKVDTTELHLASSESLQREALMTLILLLPYPEVKHIIATTMSNQF